MAGYGYSYVTDKAFSAFARELEQGVWKSISIEKYDVPSRVPAALFLEAPRPVVWKTRVRWSTAGLDEALGVASAAELAELDAEWDSAQRALHMFLGSAAEHREPAHREAALRLRGALLAGAGTEQAGYGYDAEVDFGWHQVATAERAPLAADVKKVGAAAHLKRVEEATAALAKGLGRGPGQKRAAPRSKRIREAMAACRTAFNAIHEEIDWLIEHTPNGEHRQRLVTLRAPFLALLERNPPRALPATEENEGTGESPAPPPGAPAVAPS